MQIFEALVSYLNIAYLHTLFWIFETHDFYGDSDDFKCVVRMCSKLIYWIQSSYRRILDTHRICTELPRSSDDATNSRFQLNFAGSRRWVPAESILMLHNFGNFTKTKLTSNFKIYRNPKNSIIKSLIQSLIKLFSLSLRLWPLCSSSRQGAERCLFYPANSQSTPFWTYAIWRRTQDCCRHRPTYCENRTTMCLAYT